MQYMWRQHCVRISNVCWCKRYPYILTFGISFRHRWSEPGLSKAHATSNALYRMFNSCQSMEMGLWKILLLRHGQVYMFILLGKIFLVWLWQQCSQKLEQREPVEMSHGWRHLLSSLLTWDLLPKPSWWEVRTDTCKCPLTFTCCDTYPPI